MLDVECHGRGVRCRGGGESRVHIMIGLINHVKGPGLSPYNIGILLQHRCYFHFTNEKTEAQRSQNEWL